MDRVAEWIARVATARYRVSNVPAEKTAEVREVAKKKLLTFLDKEPASPERLMHSHAIRMDQVTIDEVLNKYIDNNESYERKVDTVRAASGQDTCMKWYIDAVTEVMGEEPPPPTPQPRPVRRPVARRRPPSPPYVPPPVIRDRMPPVAFNISVPTPVEVLCGPSQPPPQPPPKPMNAEKRRQRKRMKTQKSPSCKRRSGM